MISSLRDGRTDRLETKNWMHGLEIHLYGACGEIATAKALGCYYDGSVNRFSNDEHRDLLGNIEVRHRTNHEWDLKVTERDPAGCILVLTTGIPPEIHVRGWITRERAEEVGEVKDYGDYGKPCLWVGAQHLQGIETLERSS